jgi:hypothetical protein
MSRLLTRTVRLTRHATRLRHSDTSAGRSISLNPLRLAHLASPVARAAHLGPRATKDTSTRAPPAICLSRNRRTVRTSCARDSTDGAFRALPCQLSHRSCSRAHSKRSPRRNYSRPLFSMSSLLATTLHAPPLRPPLPTVSEEPEHRHESSVDAGARLSPQLPSTLTRVARSRVASGARGAHCAARGGRNHAQTKTTWSLRCRPSPSYLPAPWRIARVTTVGWATRRLAGMHARRPHVLTFGATASYGFVWAPLQRKPRSTQGTTIPRTPAPSWTTG